MRYREKNWNKFWVGDIKPLSVPRHHLCNFYLLLCQPLPSLLSDLFFTYFKFTFFAFKCHTTSFIHCFNPFSVFVLFLSQHKMLKYASYFLCFKYIDAYFMCKNLLNLNKSKPKTLLFSEAWKCLNMSLVNHVTSAVTERSWTT